LNLTYFLYYSKKEDIKGVLIMKKLNNDINIKIILPFLLVLITSLSLVLILISQAMFPTDDLASMNKKEAWLSI